MNRLDPPPSDDPVCIHCGEPSAEATCRACALEYDQRARRADAAFVAHGLTCALRRFELDGDGKGLARVVSEAIEALKGRAA